MSKSRERNENLFDGGRPRKSEAQEDNEEERTPKIPITQSLSRILSIGIREHHQLQIAHDPRQIPLHRVPHGLGEGVRGRSEPGGSDTRRGRGRGRRRRGGGDRWHLVTGRGKRGEVGGDEGGGRRRG